MAERAGQVHRGPGAARRVRDRGRPAGAGPAAPQRPQLRERRPAADGRHDQGRRRGRLDGDHPDGQARPVAAEQQPAAADRRRSDHCRRQRRLVRTHPSNTTLVVQVADDDGLLWWLSDRSQAAAHFVKNYLWTHTAPAVDYAGQTITVQHSGLREIFAGQQSAQFFGVSSPTRTTRTYSRSPRSARYTRPARRSPNTAATTRAIGTFRSSSMRRAPCSLGRQAR